MTSAVSGKRAAQGGPSLRKGAKPESVHFYRKKMFFDQLLLVDGITRGGKFLLGNILAGLEDVEHVQYFLMFELIPALVKIQKMPLDTGVTLLRNEVDMHVYEYAIGRNLNFRHGDKSSIFNSNYLQALLARCFSEDGPGVLERIKNENKCHQYVTHGLLANVDVFFEAVPHLKMIHILRHPADVVHSWFVRGWGKRFGVDPLDFTPALEGVKGPVPLFAYEWRDEYEMLPEMDRIIRSVSSITRDFEESYVSLPDGFKKQILFVSFESVVEDTIREIERMSLFLDTKPSKAMAVTLARERCPAKLSKEKRASKMADIKAQASKEMFWLLKEMEDRYPSRVKTWTRD